MRNIIRNKMAAAILACSLALGGSAAASVNPQAAAIDASEQAESVFSPDLSNYLHWDGKSDFKENTNYYISGDMEIHEKAEFTLPASSILYIADMGSLSIFKGGRLIINGSFVIAENASVTVSGRLILNGGGTVRNYGTFASTKNAITDISSAFTSYADSASSFGGFTNVYKNGQISGYGDVLVPSSSALTVTGIVRLYENACITIKGKVESTLNGRIVLAGKCVLSGSLLTSGTLTIEKTADFRKEKGSLFGNYKTGRCDDYREEQGNKLDYSVAGGGMKGIDVSSWQGVIDWDKVAKSGVKFAIIRSSYGDGYVDKMFEYNIAAAKKAGLYVGVYHYCYALTDEEAKAEAQFFIETIKPYEIDFPVMFDFEDPSQVKLGKFQLTRMANIFMKELDSAGYYPMLYSYKNWLNNNLIMSYIDYEVAVAEWNVSKSTYKGDYGLWQYSCTGLVSGIEGDVDLDICYKDYPTIIREGGWNHLSKSE